MTYDKLKKLIYKGDPLANEDSRIVIDSKGLTIFGYDHDGDYANDLKIVITDKGYLLFYRDPADLEWEGPFELERYEDVVHIAYEL